jgi:hypothetical protein
MEAEKCESILSYTMYLFSSLRSPFCLFSDSSIYGLNVVYNLITTPPPPPMPPPPSEEWLAIYYLLCIIHMECSGWKINMKNENMYYYSI